MADSGEISATGWTVPSGDLTWGQTYYWTVQDYDGVDTSTSGTTNYFATPVPQPLVTSGLSQNEDGPGYDAGSGDYTTSSTDAQVPTVGPALEITRDYNSQDPRLTGRVRGRLVIGPGHEGGTRADQCGRDHGHRGRDLPRR